MIRSSLSLAKIYGCSPFEMFGRPPSVIRALLQHTDDLLGDMEPEADG